MNSLKYLAGALLIAAAGFGAASCKNDAYCFSCETGGDGGSGGNQGGGGTGTGGISTCEEDCVDGTECCNGSCVDVIANTQHCGGCGKVCEDGANGTASCVAGKCTFECGFGFADCNLLSDDGCEVEVSSDPAHCGDCETICLFANATPQCASGQCGILMCNAGFDNCNGMLADGCETNLGTDPENCSTCGNACPSPPNAKPDCLAGQCAFGGCLLGFGDCDNDMVDGCEIDLTKDQNNCGTCGYVCPDLPNATPTCNNAACVIGACDMGWADCDASTFDGCESFLATDVNNCGACNQPCGMLPHAYPKCENSQCAIGGCEAGFADCDGIVLNGCEVDLSSDEANCASCGNVCPAIANGTAKCSGFVCGIDTCNMGFADCFGGATDGCETNLTSDVGHCGTCGNGCPNVPFGAKACVNSMCTIGSCGQDHSDCNGNVMDGCETDTTADIMNCGGCNVVCPTPMNGTPSCAASACTLGTCDAGYANCNNNAADGCEFNTQSDANNCGGCGIKCHSGMCSNAACVCQKSVLLLPDDSPTGSAVLATALTAAGFTVTTAAVPSYQYNGTNPALTNFGAVIVLSGGPSGQASVTTDMPVAGQQAILDFVNVAGGGLVLTEWAAYHVASNRWQTLKPLVLLQRTVAYSGQVVYTIDPGFTAHPLWLGLPASFTIASTSNVGTAKIGTGITRIAGSPQAIDAVAIRDTPVGRVAEIAHAGNYAPNGWSNTNVQKLVANAVDWVARCK
ncbi:MAG: hypothetical protein IPK82_38230 [Polyangiaceae bacterium]|nr:hypothetical protein [Polyangiaceae bacterium]